MVTDSQIAHYIAMFIVFVMATSFSIGCYKKEGIKPLSDKFELGYIEDSPIQYVTPQEPYNELEELKREVEIAKLKKQLQELNNPKPIKTKPKVVKSEVKKTQPDIFDDCISALVSLGTPVRKAKADVQNVFDQNPNIKTVQQFITEYGKRCA
jgi:hypothetical protein